MAASASMHPTLVGSNLRCAPQSSGRKRASGPLSGSTAPLWVSRRRGMPFAAGLLPICSARAPQSVTSFWRGPGGRAPSSVTSAARRWTRGLRPTLLRRTAPASWRRSLTSPGRTLDSSLPVWRLAGRLSRWLGIFTVGLSRESPGLHALPSWGLPDPGGGLGAVVRLGLHPRSGLFGPARAQRSAWACALGGFRPTNVQY